MRISSKSFLAAEVEDCPCQHGCPSCIIDPHCREYNRFLSKRGALASRLCSDGVLSRTRLSFAFFPLPLPLLKLPLVRCHDEAG